MCDVFWDVDDENDDSSIHSCEYEEGHSGEHRCHCGAILEADEEDEVE